MQGHVIGCCGGQEQIVRRTLLCRQQEGHAAVAQVLARSLLVVGDKGRKMDGHIQQRLAVVLLSNRGHSFVLL